MTKFWDIVVCLNFLWKSTEQALSHLSHCSRKVRMFNTCARAKITWYAKGRKQNNCWPFFSACPHMFLFKSLLAAKILVMISKLSFFNGCFFKLTGLEWFLNSPSLSGNEMFFYSVRKVLRVGFCPRDKKKPAFQKFHVWKALFQNVSFWWSFSSKRVDGRPVKILNWNIISSYFRRITTHFRGYQ